MRREQLKTEKYWEKLKDKKAFQSSGMSHTFLLIKTRSSHRGGERTGAERGVNMGTRGGEK